MTNPQVHLPIPDKLVEIVASWVSGRKDGKLIINFSKGSIASVVTEETLHLREDKHLLFRSKSS